METILIATDFSTASRNAALYGWQLAKAMKAKLILFTAYQVSHPIAALNVQVSHFDVKMQNEKKLADEAEAISNKVDDQMELVSEEGQAHEAIGIIAAEKKADLIIIGMKGSGKNLKNLFGSTTTSMVNSLTVPVIIVPEEAKFSKPKNILYASDVFLDTTITAIDRVKFLTDFFASKLFVVRVVKDSYEEVRETVNTPQNFRKELKKMETTFHFPVNANTTDGLTGYIKEQPVDLVVMLPHKHEWVERLFVKSETKDMVFHAQLPILMLPDATVAPANTDAIHKIENYSYDQ